MAGSLLSHWETLRRESAPCQLGNLAERQKGRSHEMDRVPFSSSYLVCGIDYLLAPGRRWCISIRPRVAGLEKMDSSAKDGFVEFVLMESA